jgi:hypothetical protein
MPVQTISHDANGNEITRVPVEHKVALGLPKGYKQTPTSTPTKAPQKLFHFLVQTRNNDGEWQYDKTLAAKLFGKGDEAEKPREIKIQLVGNHIEDMVYSDLFYWHSKQGAKCSSREIKSYLQQWCEDNNIPWKKPLSDIKTLLELNMLLTAKKIDERLKSFIQTSERFVTLIKGAMGDDYDFDVDDIINANLANRRPNAGGPVKSYPCTFRKCPDYVGERCRYNGRFFFVFDGHDIGEIATMVTSSPKNIQNIQWGLKTIVEKVLEGRKDDEGRELTMHGITVKLTGRPEKGMYSGKERQSSTKFFVVKIKGPEDTSTRSAQAIIAQAREMQKLYPGGMKVVFDEGNELDLAKDRIAEFTPIEDDAVNRPTGAKKDKLKVKDEKAKPGKKSKKNKTSEYSDGIKKLVSETKKIKKNIRLVYMIDLFARAADELKVSNGLEQLKTAFASGVVKESLTVNQILQSQKRMKDLGSKTDFAKELKQYDKQQEKK